MPNRSNDITAGLNSLGKSGLNAVANEPSLEILEAFPNRFPQRDYIVTLEFPEFTSLCPVTGQPDFGTIKVNYIPDFLCVESKSFKLYLFAFRYYQSFMETMTNRILEDLDMLLAPRWLSVAGLFAPRGATKINVFAEKYKNLRKAHMSNVRKTVANFRLIDATQVASSRK